MNLAQLEALFWQTARTHEAPRGLSQHFVDSEKLTALRRMGVYHSAYWARQERTLAEIFSRVSALLGEQTFRKKVALYLERFPSEAPAIEWVGRRFPTFLAADASTPRALVGLAQLEWARLEARMAPDAAEPLTKERLRGLDFPNVRVTLRPSVRLLCVLPEALELWPEEAALPPDSPEKPPVDCIVFRKKHRVQHRTLTPLERKALDEAARESDFASLCSVFFGPDAARLAASSIDRWLKDELLCTPPQLAGSTTFLTRRS